MEREVTLWGWKLDLEEQTDPPMSQSRDLRIADLA